MPQNHLESNLPKRWLNVAEAAEYIGCSQAFLHKDRLTKIHRIPYSRLGRSIRYDRLALDEYLERRGGCEG